jgi:hypothetical protein
MTSSCCECSLRETTQALQNDEGSASNSLILPEGREGSGKFELEVDSFG